MHVVGWAFLAVAIAMFVGAMLQGVIGFGAIILAFPILVVAEPALLPQTALLAGLPMTILMVWRHWRGAAWSEVGWFTLGRPLGFVGAVSLLAILDRRTLTLWGGLIVLVAVGLSLWAPTIRRTPATLTTGGFVSALFGTSIAIGGPPIGLLFQDEEGPKLRSTVSVLMLFGNPVSILVLAVTGNISETDFRTGLALMPFMLAGNVSARAAIPYFDQRLRPVILSVCALAAVAAMIRVAVT